MKKLTKLSLILASVANLACATNNNYMLAGVGITDAKVPTVNVYYGHTLYNFANNVTLNAEFNGSLLFYTFNLGQNYKIDGQGNILNLSEHTTNNVLMSLVPMFNIKLTDNLSLDAGIGLGYMVNGKVNSKAFNDQATNFNFSNNLGLRYDYNDFVTIIRVQHLSNANTYLPNYGINTVSISFGTTF